MTTSDRNILASKMEVDKGILVNLLTSGSNPFTKLAVITVASLWVIMNAERAEKPSESSKSISEFALQSYRSFLGLPAFQPFFRVRVSAAAILLHPSL